MQISFDLDKCTEPEVATIMDMFLNRFLFKTIQFDGNGKRILHEVYKIRVTPEEGIYFFISPSDQEEENE